MHEERHGPSAEAFHDPVVKEDPSRWGPHEREHATTTSSTTATKSRTTTMSGINAEPPVRRPTVSIGATFLGWVVAAFFTFVFSAIALALMGAEAIDGTVALGTLAWSTLLGYLVASFLAYVIGGYTAGRISLWNGVSHGLGTVAWAVLFAIAGILAGTYLSNVFDLAIRVDLANVTTYAVLAIVLALLAMLAGAALGGRLGERYHAVSPRAIWRGRTVGRRRGRPF